MRQWRWIASFFRTYAVAMQPKISTYNSLAAAAVAENGYNDPGA